MKDITKYVEKKNKSGFENFINAKNDLGITAIHYASFRGIVDLIKFWTQFNLNILKNNNLSNLIMDFIHQSINQENPENILILKHIAELLNKAIGSSIISKKFHYNYLFYINHIIN